MSFLLKETSNRKNPVKRLSKNHKKETVVAVLQSQLEACEENGIFPPQVTLTTVQKIVEQILATKYTGINAVVSATYMQKVFESHGWFYSNEHRQWVRQPPDTITV